MRQFIGLFMNLHNLLRDLELFNACVNSSYECYIYIMRMRIPSRTNVINI